MKKMWNKFKAFIRRRSRAFKVIVGSALLIGLLFVGLQKGLGKDSGPQEVSFNDFIEQAKEGKIDKVEWRSQHEFIRYQDKEGTFHYTTNPKSEDFKRELLEADIEVFEKSNNSLLSTIISFILQFGLFFLLAFYVYKSSNPDAKEDMVLNIPGVDFDTVAGNEEAKEEMQVMVDFLKNPKKYKGKGAYLPKGAIFYGPPGTGKTMMARAVAGEAGVPFMSISGSDFVNLYVGAGARRVRSLFKEARKNAPSIIFIDEIDSVGSSRSGESNSEYKQTINALLNEMDGFKVDDQVIVIAATNRLDDLDSALIRPGRFDKQVAIGVPDKKDRLAILSLHAKGKTLADDVDLEKWANLTVGFAGADLAAMMNEAAILSVVNEREAITNADLENAHYKLVMKGNKKKNQADRNMKELKVVAWHEAGHALLAKRIANQSVPKVSILSSTSGAGGVTFITPNDNSLPSKRELEERIITLYGGRIAEEILLKDPQEVTAGASQDIKEATRLIRMMLTELGMSEGYGMLHPGILYGENNNAQALLVEAKKLSAELYERASQYLIEHEEELEAIAQVLLEKETINEDELDEILERKVVA